MTDFAGMTGDDGGSRRQAAAASTDASAAKREVSELAHELGRMRLACAAVWELVKEKTGMTEEDLIAKMAIMDAKDGVADGELTRGVKKCVKCGRTVKSRQNKCMYCGLVQPVESVFEGI